MTRATLSGRALPGVRQEKNCVLSNICGRSVGPRRPRAATPPRVPARALFWAPVAPLGSHGRLRRGPQRGPLWGPGPWPFETENDGRVFKIIALGLPAGELQGRRRRVFEQRRTAALRRPVRRVRQPPHDEGERGPARARWAGCSCEGDLDAPNLASP